MASRSTRRATSTSRARGAWIISPEARHLGTISAPELPANFAWGDADGRTLYMTARTGLYRIRTSIPGIRPAMAS
jgi:gluconolactonase